MSDQEFAAPEGVATEESAPGSDSGFSEDMFSDAAEMYAEEQGDQNADTEESEQRPKPETAEGEAQTQPGSKETKQAAAGDLLTDKEIQEKFKAFAEQFGAKDKAAVIDLLDSGKKGYQLAQRHLGKQIAARDQLIQRLRSTPQGQLHQDNTTLAQAVQDLRQQLTQAQQHLRSTGHIKVPPKPSSFMGQDMRNVSQADWERSYRAYKLFQMSDPDYQAQQEAQQRARQAEEEAELQQQERAHWEESVARLQEWNTDLEDGFANGVKNSGLNKLDAKLLEDPDLRDLVQQGVYAWFMDQSSLETAILSGETHDVLGNPLAKPEDHDAAAIAQKTAQLIERLTKWADKYNLAKVTAWRNRRARNGAFSDGADIDPSRGASSKGDAGFTEDMF